MKVWCRTIRVMRANCGFAALGALTLAARRAISDARVAGAIGQAFDRRAAAEAEVLGAGGADRPAALFLPQLEQAAATAVEDRDVLDGRLGERHLQQRTLGEDIERRALGSQ